LILYYGHLAKTWETAINNLNPTLAITGQQLMTQLVKIVWTYILYIWMLCNQHLHQDAGHLSIPNYQQAVIIACEIGTQLPPAIQEALFQHPLEHMLEQPPAILCSWLEQSHKYMKQQLKAVQTQAKLNTPDIHLFFCPITHAVNDLNPL